MFFHVFEILLITPFTNTKVKRMFSRMARESKLIEEIIEVVTD